MRRTRLGARGLLISCGQGTDVDLSRRAYVEYINDFGAREASIDSRGLFKVLLHLVAEQTFDPQ